MRHTCHLTAGNESGTLSYCDTSKTGQILSMVAHARSDVYSRVWFSTRHYSIFPRGSKSKCTAACKIYLSAQRRLPHKPQVPVHSAKGVETERSIDVPLVSRNFASFYVLLLFISLLVLSGASAFRSSRGHGCGHGHIILGYSRRS